MLTSARGAIAFGAILGVALAALGAQAQGVTLADALKQALRSDNPTLQQQNDKVAVAAGQAREAKGQFDWSADARAGWEELFVPTPDRAGLLSNRTETANTFYYSADMSHEFRNGVSIAPGLIAYPGSGATPAQTAGLTELRPQLGLKVPLLRGLGSGAVDAPERAAADVLESAKEDREFAVRELAETVAQTFWQCVADDLVLADARQADADAAAYGQKLADMAKKGLVEPTVFAEWNANSVVQRLAVGAAEDVARQCRRDLAYAMTGSAAEPWPDVAGDLPSVAGLAPEVEKLDEQQMIELALDQRLDLRSAAGSLVAARETLRGAKNAALPLLDLHVDPYSAFLTFSKPLGNNVAKGREAVASAQADEASVALQQLEDKVRDDVGDAVSGLKRSASDCAALDAAQKQMQTVVADAQKRARFGSIEWLDAEKAQSELTDLRKQAIAAHLAFAQGLATLRFVTGTIDPASPALPLDLARPPS